MRTMLSLTAALVVAGGATLAGGAELTSGLQVGESVGAFNVEKCAGVEDGVKVGAKLCYR